MALFSKGQLVTYADANSVEHTAILQNDVDTESQDRDANLSLWSVTVLGVILTDPRLNVTHVSEAEGAPYWVQFNGEYQP